MPENNTSMHQDSVEGDREKDKSLTLIAADADRVQSYVFESAKLAEMRGASLILDLLNVKDGNDQKWGDVDVAKGIPQLLKEMGLQDDSLIYAAGGGASIIAPKDRAEEIKKEIAHLYIKATLSATTTVIDEPWVSPNVEKLMEKAKQAKGEAWRLFKDNLVSEGQWKQCDSSDKLKDEQFNRAKGFGWMQTAASYRLRRAKHDKRTAPVFEVSPFTERCGYCHFRPAYKIAPEIDERSICRVCDHKRQDRGEDIAKSFYLNRFHTYLNEELQNGRVPNYLRGGDIERNIPSKEKAAAYLNTWNEIKSPRDLEAVAKSAKGKVSNFVGVIYADGNNMGAKLDSFDKPEEFQRFSEKVRNALERAVFSGLGDLLDGHHVADYEYRSSGTRKRRRSYKYQPFEIISIGGDDVYMFVPADVALELAHHLCQQFERAFGGELTLAAGVLIAHVSTPIYFSRSIVKGLLKNAKKLSKAADLTQSAIDFQVITGDTAISEETAEFRKRTYRNRFENEGLTTRPLTLPQLGNLIETVRCLKAKKFPKSQLYILREAVVRGPQPRATNYYYYQQARSLEMTKKYEPLHHFLSAGGDHGHLPFWKNAEGWREAEMVTPIVDLVEIYDFVRNQPLEKEEP
jgi:CRISPR-associated protein Cmr2